MIALSPLAGPPLKVRRLACCLGALALVGSPSLLAAQLSPPSTGGAIALAHALRMLGHHKRVLMIGAHPDDEDTELLTLLVRDGAEAAYLSLNRGEGGQNLLGPELGDALGLIRTEELLAARRLDGARQYFTRAYDFGYSKSLDDVWEHWPRDSILKDIVRIIRRFRPQIVVSAWSGTQRDGHGQHQASGVLTRDAFQVAGSAAAFPELEPEEGLRPWAPAKLYRSARFDPEAATLILEGGVLDPAVGQSVHQIAMQSRSLHRSQDMGVLQRIGPSSIHLALVEDKTGGAGTADGLFAGIDTTLAPLLGRDEAERYREAIHQIVNPGPAPLPAPAPHRLQEARTGLMTAFRILHSAASRGAQGEEGGRDGSNAGLARLVLGDQLRHLHQVRHILDGRVIDAVIDDPRVVPGQDVSVQVTAVTSAGTGEQHLPPLLMPTGWTALADSIQPCQTFGTSQSCSRRSRLRVGPESPPTNPYFLTAPRKGAMYDWSAVPAAQRGEPFEEPALAVYRDIPPALTVVDPEPPREVTYRFTDQATGELRLPLTVIPRVGVRFEPASTVWPIEGERVRRFRVTLVHGATGVTRGEVRLEVPDGWPHVAPQRFDLQEEDQQSTYTFEVARPAQMAAGRYGLRAVAVADDGGWYTNAVVTIQYPHIRPRSYVAEARVTVVATPLSLPGLDRVGYVRGASDRVPEALRDIGVPVEELAAADLLTGDLSPFDAIVIGSRAYEINPALARANGRLLDYVNAGGLVIVQYQQYLYFSGGYAPYPLTVGGRPPQLTPDDAARQTAGRSTAEGGGGADGASGIARANRHDRVTDERAPVTLLDPTDPVLARPNHISAADFDGWVQERGLYFARTWDRAYRSVLETHDPGPREPPLEGGLLIARVGRGTYVYTGLSFFRQLPQGVSGAFRLFANLLAIGGTAEGREGE